MFRNGEEPELEFQDERQRPFGAADELRQVERFAAGELIEVVTADAAHDLREARFDLSFMLGDDAVPAPVEGAEPVTPRQLLLQAELIELVQPVDAAVSEQHLHGQHLVDRAAVLDGAGTGGVVGDHAADVRAVGGGYVRGELQPVRRQVSVQLVTHHARFHPHPALFDVQFEDAGQVLRHVDHQGSPDGLARQAGAAAARQDRHAVRGRDLHGAPYVFGVQRQDHAVGDYLVTARVSRVDRARTGIEMHLAADLALQLLLELLQGGAVRLFRDWLRAYSAGDCAVHVGSIALNNREVCVVRKRSSPG